MRTRHYQVKQVAEISGLSVRALHHYDAIGLLVPSLRTAAGYRLYTDADLLRLQQILVGRELGLPLEQIRRGLDDPGFDRRGALLEQRAELERRGRKVAEMIRSIDAALALVGRIGPAVDHALETEGQSMDMQQIFGGFDPAQHEAEVQQRWGTTAAYQVSSQRTRGYSAQDWQRFREEQDSIYAAAVAVLQAGQGPDVAAALEVAERHRLLIDRWFYPCSTAMHCALADLYESDSRFQASIEQHGAGLTRFLAEAIRANARRE